MKKFFVTAAVLIAALAANGQTPDELVLKYNDAMAKAQAKDFAGAATVLEEVVKTGEGSTDEAVTAVVTDAKNMLPQLWFMVGGTLVNQKKVDEGVVYLEKAANAGFNNAKGVLGQIYKAQAGLAFNNKEYEKAAEIYAKAFEVAPLDQEVAITLAESYARADKPTESFELFRKLIASKVWPIEGIQSRFANTLLVRANEIAAAEPAAAIDLLAEAVDNDSTNATAWLLLMKTASDSGNNNKVIEFGERAATALAADAARKSTAYFQLGVAYAKAGNNAKAIEAYGKVTAGPNAAAAKTNIDALQAN